MFAKRIGLLICLMVGLLVARPNANNSGLPNNLGTAPAGNIYVDINASGANNGTSWDNAYTTIQAAIAAAATSGDTIYVAGGTYYEGLSVSGKTVSIAGAGRRQTFLDGGGTQRVLWVDSDATVSLSGLTVQHGYSVNDTSPGGGGVYNAGTVTAIDCAFINNTGRPHGGAVYNYGGTLRVTNCLFSSNTAKYSYGGAVFNHGGTIVAANCAFTDNRATSDGSNGGSGGAIYTESQQNTFTNCTFTGNSATPHPTYGGNTWGGAISVKDRGRVSVTNSVLWGNSAVRGREIYTQTDSPSYYHPEVIVRYSDVQGIDRMTDPSDPFYDPYIFATSTIDIDPRFVAAPGNVRLLAGSPCIDVGDDNAITTLNGFVGPLPGVDLGGKPRTEGQVDMGAYERYPDNTAPILAGMPADISKEAAGPDGATARWTPPTASGDPDDADADLAITGTSNPGDTFLLGTTTVTYTAMDLEGNSVSASFTVTVQDTTPPDISGVPAAVAVEATSSAGAVVTWTEDPSATDLVDGSVPVTCSQASGSTFPVGTTTVTCTATDAAGNIGSASFSVTVRDTTAPVIAPHANMTADATSASGVVVNYTSPTWADAVSGSGTANCLPASGSLFPVGARTVTCTAADAANNVGIPTTFTVTVTNVTPPPSTITITATPSTIWPPNKKMVPVKLVVTPANATARIVSVTCNETIAASDVKVNGPTVNLRADRNGNGTGRVYTITVAYGTSSTTTVLVKVPHDQGK